jgi:hypothetical protein
MEPYRIPPRHPASLLMVAGSVRLLPQGLAFESNDGIKTVPCSITRDALLDLCGYHGLNGNDGEAFKALGPQIERLASQKYRAGRIDRSGELTIKPADLLLYGFESAY